MRHPAFTLTLLLSGQSIISIARDLGVTRQAVHDWKKLPAFQTALSKGCDDLWGQSASQLRSLLPPSIDTLEEQVLHPNHRTSHRAIATVLRTAIKLFPDLKEAA